MILAHVLFHFTAAEADELCDKCKNNTDQGSKTEPPVNNQQDDNHDDRGCDRRDKIRELVGNKTLHAFNVLVHDLAQTTAANRQMIT